MSFLLFNMIALSVTQNTHNTAESQKLCLKANTGRADMGTPVRADQSEQTELRRGGGLKEPGTNTERSDRR